MEGEALAPLSEAQQEIMEIIWDAGEITASEVRARLAVRRSVARNTVQTLMTRMYEKGWLAYRPIGRTFLYTAAVPRKQSLGEKARALVDSAFGGSAEELMTALIEYRGISKNEARNIRSMLEDAEKKGSS